MSYIPDCRDDEDYNVKYMNKSDKDFIRGFDYCVSSAVDIFFDNLSDLEDTYLMHHLNESVPPVLREEYDTYDFDGNKDTRLVETYADMLRKSLLEWIESERDELIVSIIDSMSDEDYDRNRERSYQEGE